MYQARQIIRTIHKDLVWFILVISSINFIIEPPFAPHSYEAPSPLSQSQAPSRPRASSHTPASQPTPKSEFAESAMAASLSNLQYMVDEKEPTQLSLGKPTWDTAKENVGCARCKEVFTFFKRRVCYLNVHEFQFLLFCSIIAGVAVGNIVMCVLQSVLWYQHWAIKNQFVCVILAPGILKVCCLPYKMIF